ncbi:MAG TPA: hypothetical protein VGL63_08820 [Streptosporangiaceae bacterium]|jgi:hypothetical protein
MTGTKLTLTIGAAALLLAACSSPSTSGRPSANTIATHPASAQPTPTAAASAPATAPSALTGTWNGRYGGSYQGTFVIRWQQSGSKLGGTIHISEPTATLGIHGSLAGGSIQFGTVGSYAITYSGTVSGHTMSGTYQVGGTQGGNWSASKA